MAVIQPEGEFMRRAFRSSVLLLVAFCIVDFATALPRFASRTGAKCQSCHVNPSGGGMRQTFGVQYGRDELPVPTWSEELGLDDFSTKLSDVVSVGADFRTLFFYQEHPLSNNNAFFQMQGDVYMNFRVAKKVSMYLDKGLYTGFEIFGLLNLLPANGYIKVGKFLPNYGLKMDDHRTFVRDRTGFSPESRTSGGVPELTGGEVAVSPGSFTIMGGIYNAKDQIGQATEDTKALLGRAEGIFKLSEGVNLSIGGNVFSTKMNGIRTTIFGGFGSFSYQNLTLLEEADVIQANGTVPDVLVTLTELDYAATPGLDLKFMYEFYDQDIDLKTGSTSRYTVGFEFFPISGVEVRPLYRIPKESQKEVKNNEFLLIIHFFL
jgi:hypothetical protein